MYKRMMSVLFLQITVMFQLTKEEMGKLINDTSSENEDNYE